MARWHAPRPLRETWTARRSTADGAGTRRRPRRRNGGGACLCRRPAAGIITSPPGPRPARLGPPLGRRAGNGGAGGLLQQRPSHDRGARHKQGAGEKGRVVAGGERARLPPARRQEEFGAGPGHAHQDPQAEGSPHHERAIHDARHQAGLRRSFVRGREHDGVEGDAVTEAQENPARQHVRQEAAVDGRPRQQQQARSAQ